MGKRQNIKACTSVSPENPISPEPCSIAHPPDGCGLILFWANKGHHPTREYLEPDDVGEQSAVAEPVGPLMRDVVSKAQIRWSRGVIAQCPQKIREQICRENGGISWAQLEHFARTPLAGLPERATKWAKDQGKATAAKAETKPTAKPKATKKAKQAR